MSNDFTPFYTRQPNIITLQRQLEKWAEKVKDYCKARSICKLNAQTWQNTNLFSNPVIKRRCHVEFIKEILKYMAGNSLALLTTDQSDIPNTEWIVTEECHSGGYKTMESNDSTYIILTWSVSEVADSLLTLPAQLYTGYELRDEQYQGIAFQSCPIEILKIALAELERQKKLKVIKNSTFDETGIKVL